MDRSGLRWPGLFSVGLDGGMARMLVRVRHDFLAAPTIDVPPLDPLHHRLMVPAGGADDEVVVGRWQLDGSGDLDSVLPVRLNVATGRSRSLAQGMPDKVQDWLLDPQGEPRVAVAHHQGQVTVWWRAPGSPAWVDSTVWFKPSLARLQAVVDQRLPGRVNRISCRRCTADDAVLLVQSWSDQDPGQPWLHQPALGEDPGRWQRVAALRKDIEPRQMARLDLHRFKARDGLEIPVWITQPRPAPAGAGLAPQEAAPRPAVLLAHGQMDRRVPVVHAERLRDAMAAAGHAPEWVLYPDEGHGWLKPANRFDFAQRMERFLAEHLK